MAVESRLSEACMDETPLLYVLRRDHAQGALGSRIQIFTLSSLPAIAEDPHQPMSTAPKNKANLRVIEEWPIPGGLPRSGLITWKIRCSDREVLLCEDGGEHCFHLNLENRLLTKVEWPKPDWAKTL